MVPSRLFYSSFSCYFYSQLLVHYYHQHKKTKEREIFFALNSKHTNFATVETNLTTVNITTRGAWWYWKQLWFFSRKDLFCAIIIHKCKCTQRNFSYIFIRLMFVECKQGSSPKLSRNNNWYNTKCLLNKYSREEKDIFLCWYSSSLWLKCRRRNVFLKSWWHF